MQHSLKDWGGFTRKVIAHSGEGLELRLLLNPNVDTDYFFRAWDRDAEEWITVTGWMFTFEDEEE